MRHLPAVVKLSPARAAFYVARVEELEKASASLLEKIEERRADIAGLKAANAELLEILEKISDCDLHIRALALDAIVKAKEGGS